MMQKIKDLLALLRKDRRTQVIVGIIVLALLFLEFGKPRPYRPPPPPPLPTTIRAENDNVDDLVLAFKSSLDTVTSKLEESQERQQTLEKNMAEFEHRTADIFKKLLERMSELDRPAADPMPPLTGQDIEEPIELDELDAFGDVHTLDPTPLPDADQSRSAFIAPGDTVRIRLLAGVHAPTDGSPYPVLFQLVDDVAGPDSSSLPLGEARLVAAAQGSLVDSRALFRLTRLSIRLPNGKRKVVGVDGWVVGEDGIRGMAGILIDPIGRVILGAGFAGGISGLGEGLAAANSRTYIYGSGTTQTTTEDAAAYAAGQALTGAANQWSTIIKERLDKLVPVVQVLSGREATAIFSDGVTVDELYDALNEDDYSFAGLD